MLSPSQTDHATHVAAYLVVRGMILIQRRAPDREFLPSAWDVVGGRIEPGEQPLAALQREVAEETGLTVIRTSPWLSRTEFERDGELCVEIGALAWIDSDRFELKLERGKASAFALIRDPRAFADDNEARGYGRHIEKTITLVIRELDDNWSEIG